MMSKGLWIGYWVLLKIMALLNNGMIFASRKGAKNQPLVLDKNLNSYRIYATPKFFYSPFSIPY